MTNTVKDVLMKSLERIKVDLDYFTKMCHQAEEQAEHYKQNLNLLLKHKDDLIAALAEEDIK